MPLRIVRSILILSHEEVEHLDAGEVAREDGREFIGGLGNPKARRARRKGDIAPEPRTIRSSPKFWELPYICEK